MLSWLARRIVKDAWFVVGTWAVIAFVLLAPALGGAGIDGLFDRLGSAKTAVDDSQSARGEAIYSALQGDGKVVTLQVTGLDLDTQFESVSSALAPVHADLYDLVGEVNVFDPFLPTNNENVKALIAQDRSGFLLTVTVNPNGRAVASPDDSAYARQLQRDVQRVTDRLSRVPDDLRPIAPGASGIVSTDDLVSVSINDRAGADLARGEALALPAALLIMVLVFGGLLVAGMPLLGGLASIISSLGVLWLTSLVVDPQGLEVAVVAMIGLGLSINDALLMTIRFREELGLGRADPRAAASPASHGRRRRTGRRDPLIAEAMDRTMLTAGRTVLLSTAAVALPLAALVAVGTPSLRVTAIAGAIVVALAALSAITLVPATLVLLHGFMARPPLLGRVPVLRALVHPVDGSSRDQGAFAALARWAQWRPWPVLAACVALLALLAWPLAHLHLLVSERDLLPPDADQRVYQRVLKEQYPNLAAADAVIIIQATGDSATSFINDRVAGAPGVSSVTPPQPAGQYTVAYLNLEGSASSVSAERAVDAIRALDPPADTWVTGQAATQLDFRSALVGALPGMIIVGMGAALVLVLTVTGSLILPLLALLTTSLSLAASLGVATLLFQDGYAAGAIGVAPIGGLEGYAVATAMVLGVGLAMSREIIVLTRVRERRLQGDGIEAAVAAGLQGTGRVLTAAGAVLLVILAGFATGRLIVIKEVSVILALMVVIDAVIVRLLLFPAAMGLLGSRAWWAPRFLRRWAGIGAGGDAGASEGAGTSDADGGAEETPSPRSPAGAPTEQGEDGAVSAVSTDGADSGPGPLSDEVGVS